MFGERIEIGPGLIIEPLQVGVGDELKKVLVAGKVPGKEAEVKDRLSLVGPPLAFEARTFDKVELAADDRLDLLGFRHVIELDRAKQVAVVRERERLHPEGGRAVRQLVYPAGAIEQAIVAVDVEVYEILVG